MIVIVVCCSSSATSEQEIKAQTLTKNGEIDQAIAIYQSFTPESSRFLHLIGVLYAEKKGDYLSAIKYYERALQLQQQVWKNKYHHRLITQDDFFLYRMVKT